MNYNPTDKMLDHLRHKLVNEARSDLYLADHRLIDNVTASLLYGYDNQFGPPRSEDVQSMIFRDFNGKITPILETARVYPSEGAVKVISTMVLPTRKYEDKDNMLAIASTLFIDQEMGDTWSLVEGSDGHKFLQRVTQDNITEIINERKRRMQIHSSNLAFGSALSAQIENLAIGDKVKFYADGKIQTGSIISISASGIKIQSDSGECTVSPEAVMEIMEMSPAKQAETQEKLFEYFQQIYGPEYAKKLVRE